MAWGLKVVNNNYMGLYFCGDSKSPFMEMRFRETDNNVLNCYLASGTSFTSNTVTVNMGLNVWSHFACSFNGSTQKIYYNGVKVSEKSVTHSRTSTSLLGLLGNCWPDDTGGASYCTDYRYYDIALSDEDIAAIYTAGPQQHR